MLILSHRGFWKKPEEKNTKQSMERSFALGFGTETDLRDYKGEIVISHDIADESAMTFRQFLKTYSEHNKDLYLALNIKSDGLQVKIKSLLEEYRVTNYFVFDMSIPDTLGYLKNDLEIFTRQSEYEKNPAFYNKAIGIWLDSFESDWISRDIIKNHLSHKKMVCIVSPDLHKRDYLDAWEEYKPLCKENNLFLCTDYPEEAKKFFNL
jgi:glycerophosphoryl diester phosphodiesterase